MFYIFLKKKRSVNITCLFRLTGRLLSSKKWGEVDIKENRRGKKKEISFLTDSLVQLWCCDDSEPGPSVPRGQPIRSLKQQMSSGGKQMGAA